MGKLLSKIFGNKEMRILMLGLDAAGKTSMTSLNTHLSPISNSRHFSLFYFLIVYKTNLL
jgi:GTPase SAR1 family protein